MFVDRSLLNCLSNFLSLGELDGILVYHMLRVMKVFVESNVIDYNYPDTVELMLQVLTTLVEVRSLSDHAFIFELAN